MALPGTGYSERQAFLTNPHPYDGAHDRRDDENDTAGNRNGDNGSQCQHCEI